MSEPEVNEYEARGSPLISVIIPVYNDEQNIGRCIRSVEKQDYPRENIEIIVVDDGSTDNSAKVARQHKVKVIHQRHSSHGVARNLGVDAASHNIIATIDADDVATNSWLKESLPFLRKKNAGIVGCSHSLLNKKSDFVKIAWLERSLRHERSPESTGHLGTSGWIFKKSFFYDVGGFDPRLLRAQDMELSARVRNKGYTLLLCKKPLIEVTYPTNIFKYALSQVKKIAHMVMIYVKLNGPKGVGVHYTGLADYIQGLLPFFLLVSLVFLRGEFLLVVLLAILFVLLGLNIGFARFVYIHRHEADLGKLWPGVFLVYVIFRSATWATGLVYGTWLVISRSLWSVRSSQV